MLPAKLWHRPAKLGHREGMSAGLFSLVSSFWKPYKVYSLIKESRKITENNG